MLASVMAIANVLGDESYHWCKYLRETTKFATTPPAPPGQSPSTPPPTQPSSVPPPSVVPPTGPPAGPLAATPVPGTPTSVAPLTYPPASPPSLTPVPATPTSVTSPLASPTLSTPPAQSPIVAPTGKKNVMPSAPSHQRTGALGCNDGWIKTYPNTDSSKESSNNYRSNHQHW